MKITNILLGLFVFWYITFLAAIAFASDCTYTNNIFYDSKGQIIQAKQEYVCKSPESLIELPTPVEISYTEPYNSYNDTEDEDIKQLEMLYTIFSIIGRLNS